MPAQSLTTLAQTELETAMILDKFEQDQASNGRAEETIRSRLQVLKQVARMCNLNNPEVVKIWLSDKENKGNFPKICTWTNKTKTKFVDSYSAYLKYRQITWNPPHYQVVQKLPFIPTEQEIDLLIASCGTMLSTILQMLKETGMRIGELTQLMPIDIDTERKTVNITPEKGSNPRILPISDKLIGMIKNLPHDPRATYKTLFQNHKDTLREYLSTQRKNLAEKLNNPRLKLISFHTLRHWKGTTEYHETKDIMHVKQVLGHKAVTSTQIYVNLEAALFLQTTDHFTCKVAHNPQEELELIESGFTHVNNRGELAFYKKRK